MRVFVLLLVILTLSAFAGDRLSSVLVNSGTKIFSLSLGCHPWIVSPGAAALPPALTPPLPYIRQKLTGVV